MIIYLVLQGFLALWTTPPILALSLLQIRFRSYGASPGNRPYSLNPIGQSCSRDKL
jgi:hypothetical protein